MVSRWGCRPRRQQLSKMKAWGKSWVPFRDNSLEINLSSVSLRGNYEVQ